MRDDAFIFTFEGEFDAYNLESLSAKIDTIIETGHVHLGMNFRRLTFINSAALGYLIRTKKACEERGGELVLIQPSRFVRQAFLTLGLEELFEIFESDADALEYMRSGVPDRTVDLRSLSVEEEDSLLGGNAIIWEVRGGPPIKVPWAGSGHGVGRILNLYRDGLLFAWGIPAPDAVPAGGGITTENFDGLVCEGALLDVKFRQPLALQTHFFEAEVRVTEVERAREEDGTGAATVRVVYEDLESSGRKALDRYLDELDELREEIR